MKFRSSNSARSGRTTASPDPPPACALPVFGATPGIPSPTHRRSTDEETILVVDDSPENLNALGSLLKTAGYRVKVANSGGVALRLAAQSPKPALILLDIVMPDMNGHEVLHYLRTNTRTHDIPVVFLTAMDADEEEERAFHAGIADYIVKPFNPAIVLARVRSQLLVRQARLWLEDQNEALEAEVTRRMRENDLTQAVSLRALAHLAETRDNETGYHILRTQSYVHLLATHLAERPRFSDTLNSRYIQMVTRSAPLHDIGKVGIPDSILLKPGKLSPDEWEVMKTHTVLGCDAITHAERDIDSSVDFLRQVKEIVRWHHERWDGHGYPDGLAGDDIPVCARLMAVADVFDALISKRVYKDPYPFEDVRQIIAAERGKQFDPEIAEVFLMHFNEFESIALHFGIDDTEARRMS